MATIIDKWKQKLLDTGKGNRLINFRFNSGKNVEIVYPDLNTICDKVLKNKTLYFFDINNYIETLSDDLTIEEKFDTAIQMFNSNNNINDFTFACYNSKFKVKSELNSLYKNSNMFLEEKGVNVLYIGLGFLNWLEPKEKINLSSPVLLIPIKLEKNFTTKDFSLKLYEEDIVTNPTLTYKLKNELKVDLPQYDETSYSKDSLKTYLEELESFATKNNWTILNKSVISCFSFLKINMYKDLEENEEKVIVNPVVKKLLNKADKTEQSPSVVEKNNFKIDELDLHNVVDADSSQLEAIQMAKNGESFVLQGPPGTGKSQTITNIIAEFLHDNKKVLFVSEKQAALEVVYNNLKKVNLSRFCLELHNPKINKKGVINSLAKELTSDKVVLNSNGEDDILEFNQSKQQLDNYSNLLHTKIKQLNLSPYEIINEISLLNNVKDVEFVVENLDSLTDESLDNKLKLLAEFSGFCESIGYSYKQNPFYGLNKTTLTYADKIQDKNNLKLLQSTLTNLNDSVLKINNLLGLKILNIDDLLAYQSLLKIVANLKYFDGGLFDTNTIKTVSQKFAEYNKLLSQNKFKTEQVLQKYKQDILNLNIEEYYNKFVTSYSSFLRILKSGYRNDLRYFKSLLINPTIKLGYSTLVKDLYEAKVVKDNNKQLNNLKEEILGCFDEDNYNSLNQHFDTLCKQVDEIKIILTTTIPSLTNLTTKQFKELQSNLKSINLILEENLNKQNFVATTLFDESVVNFNKNYLSYLAEKITKLVKDFNNVENYINFYKVLISLKQNNLTKFVDFMIEQNIDQKQFKDTYKKISLKQFLFNYIYKTKEFSGFSKAKQDELINTFILKDKLKFEIAKAEITSKITQQKPSLDNLAEGSQASILLREAHKKIRHKPIRLLLNEIGELAQTLKPCFLMSPLSVSTYLNGNNCSFDVVIFDEASQIFPWDAICSIYRANQVIVVGDSKQMPPSNFFNANMFNDEDTQEEDDSLDFESILDLSLATFKTESLKWHYRSKTEELIAFSNKYFYNGELVTFPVADQNKTKMGVEYFFVENGVYDRQKNQNLVEAQKIVELVFEHFDNFPERSLGVVAFSITQQEIIEDLINDYRETHPEYEKFFDSAQKAPFFVKNLETVQGDERDTIIFSVGYAKDKDGKFIQNFGPLNKQGGERRLNVAITRAKYNVKLVASIHYFDIDSSRTSMQGSLLLREYLHYAELGVNNFKITYNTENTQFAIEEEIKEFLTQNGYAVSSNLGTSAFKINLAVKNPNEDNYLMAIETDGNNFKYAKTSREKYRLRKENLERYGWAFYRIWSIDWFLNKELVKQNLLKELEKVVKNDSLNLDVKKNDSLKFNYNEFIDIDQNSQKLTNNFKNYEFFDEKSYCKHNNLELNVENIIVPLIQTEQPITENFLTTRISKMFNARVNADFQYGLYCLIQETPIIKRCNDYYCIDTNVDTSLRLTNNMERKIDDISICEIASGLYELIKQSITIDEESLFKTLSKIIGYNRLGDNIKIYFKKALNYLIKENKIVKANLKYRIK